jgi:hypothetical protein
MRQYLGGWLWVSVSGPGMCSSRMERFLSGLYDMKRDLDGAKPERHTHLVISASARKPPTMNCSSTLHSSFPLLLLLKLNIIPALSTSC